MAILYALELEASIYNRVLFVCMYQMHGSYEMVDTMSCSSKMIFLISCMCSYTKSFKCLELCICAWIQDLMQSRMWSYVYGRMHVFQLPMTWWMWSSPMFPLEIYNSRDLCYVKDLWNEGYHLLAIFSALVDVSFCLNRIWR